MLALAYSALKATRRRGPIFEHFVKRWDVKYPFVRSATGYRIVVSHCRPDNRTGVDRLKPRPPRHSGASKPLAAPEVLEGPRLQPEGQQQVQLAQYCATACQRLLVTSLAGATTSSTRHLPGVLLHVTTFGDLVVGNEGVDRRTGVRRKLHKAPELCKGASKCVVVGVDFSGFVVVVDPDKAVIVPRLSTKDWRSPKYNWRDAVGVGMVHGSGVDPRIPGVLVVKRVPD